MKYFIITYGCQMNISDSERIAAKLKKAGHQPAKNAVGANLIVLNACSVRQSAINRVFGQLEKHRGKKIIVAGCVLATDKKKIVKKYSRVSFWNPDKYFNPPASRLIYRSQRRAYVPIMTGCDNFCSYCVVPFTRGREKSRRMNEIINEVKSLVKKGHKEIVLLGQNVNSYRSSDKNSSSEALAKEDEYKTTNFPGLLHIINSLPGDFHFTFLTSHPKDMSDELIKTIARCDKISPMIHLPVQSGDNTILRRMNRHYTAAHYQNLIKKLRAAFRKHRSACPPPTISTDIIVGFPGETKKQFTNTIKLAKTVKFDKAYIAKYSPRPGTAAAKLKDNISPAEKIRRWRLLDTLINGFKH